MTKKKDIEVWWHGIAALPSSRQDHAYHALRRVWGDHTIAGARGYYRIGTEDNVTSALFQNWALYPDVAWVSALARATGAAIGTVRRVRWAYECAEMLDARLRPFHGRDFVIPDIMLVYEDEIGTGLLAFEVKSPRKAAQAKDDRKLKTYLDLPSTRKIARRQGCLLVSEQMVEKSCHASNGNWPTLTWERLGELQLAAAYNMDLPPTIIDNIAQWIGRHFARYGICVNGLGSTPAPSRATYGSVEGYRAIEALTLPNSVERFLKGSECVEAVWRSEQAVPPLHWLAEEPAVGIIRQRKWQTTPDRLVCRWHFDWSVSHERAWH